MDLSNKSCEGARDKLGSLLFTGTPETRWNIYDTSGEREDGAFPKEDASRVNVPSFERPTARGARTAKLLGRSSPGRSLRKMRPLRWPAMAVFEANGAREINERNRRALSRVVNSRD